MRALFLVLPAMLALTGAEQARAADGPRYVSLGSSYASGPGVGRPDPDGGACARSGSNYARLLAAREGLALTDASCSGATTENILDRGQHGFPRQIDAVTAGTDLVTILIGGNDVFYVGNLAALSCRDDNRSGCRAVVPAEEVEQQFAALPGRLRSVIDAVRRRAPNARIILVGYLPAIPATGTGTCSALSLSAADAARMRSVLERLDRAIDEAGARAGLPVVRAASIGAGHDACAPTPFLSGAAPAAVPGWPEPVAFHPDQAGMDAVADAIGLILHPPGGQKTP